MIDFSVITPTSERPGAFALCLEGMRRQVFDLRGEWIIVDDSEADPHPIDGPFRSSLEVVRVRPPPLDGVTVARNYLAGYDRVRSHAVIFMEDDEWYRSDYIQTMCDLLADPACELAAAAYYRVYVLTRSTWLEGVGDPPEKAALCRTAIGGRAMMDAHIGLLARGRRDGSVGSADSALWYNTPPAKKRFTMAPGLVVSMKGIRGKARPIARTGLPKYDTPHPREAPDTTGRLAEWIGADDADRYLSLRSGGG